MQEVWRRGRLYKNTVPYLIQVSSDLVSNLFLDIQHVRLYKDEKKNPPVSGSHWTRLPKYYLLRCVHEFLPRNRHVDTPLQARKFHKNSLFWSLYTKWVYVRQKPPSGSWHSPLWLPFFYFLFKEFLKCATSKLSTKVHGRLPPFYDKIDLGVMYQVGLTGKYHLSLA